MTWLYVVGSIVALGIAFYLGVCTGFWRLRLLERLAREHWEEANDLWTKAIHIQTHPDRYQPLNAIAEWQNVDRKTRAAIIFSSNDGLKWVVELAESSDGREIKAEAEERNLVKAADLAMKRLRGEA